MVGDDGSGAMGIHSGVPPRPGCARHERFRIFGVPAWIAIFAAAAAAQTGLRITQVTDNRSSYPGFTIPKYEKLEIDFQVEGSVAPNPQMPYDPAPPPGIAPGMGISVNGHFTPDDWRTVYTQPAFLYQEFSDEVRGNREWYYPTGRFVWKVRFSPPFPGHWHYRLTAEDAGGSSASNAVSFVVSPSTNKGFLRVSPRDVRYFEFEDGTYFPALGYNMNYDHVSWRSPVLDNRANFQALAANGIQLIRIWLSQWGIFGSEWTPWNSQDPAEHGAYLPANGITFAEAYPGSDVSMLVSANRFRCMFIGLWKAPPAVKRNTVYRVRIRYKTRNMGTPIDPAQPHGFVAKIGGWLWSDDAAQRCYAAGTGIAVTPHQARNTAGWEILEGSLQTGNADFLPNFFLVMENMAQGEAFVDHVWIEEVLGGGNYGPNIVSKPWMAHHLYFEQRNSYAFDKLLALAREHGVYLRPVVMEKNDRILNRIDYAGNTAADGGGNDYFYGDGRRITKVRWLQRAWWRYLQARWGYSANIHSWELLNEGDPANGRHFALADEFGKYMHQFTANRHMVSTSTWHSFPRRDFWANPAYPDVDFADVHLYVPRDAAYGLRVDGNTVPVGDGTSYADTAAASRDLSMLVGARQSLGAGKPVIRGETGFVAGSTDNPDLQLLADREGLWLHQFIWSGINPGGLMESYWYETVHIYGRQGDGVDLRPRFRSYYNFIKDIPLNNGNYTDAAPTVAGTLLRAWGQKDTVLGRAHLWIHNTEHTWRKVVAGTGHPAAGGRISLTGFRPGTNYRVEWWDTAAGAPGRTETLQADANGNLTLTVADLVADVAVRIGDYGSGAQRPQPPQNLRILAGPN